MTGGADVVVVGAGVIGLSVAWRCAQRGLSVQVVDPAPGSGASTTAAGMLAPVTELHYTERALLHITLESARRYPPFAAELEAATGCPVGLRECGTLAVGWDGADFAALRELADFQRSLGLDASVVSGADLRGLEPYLAPGLPGGVVTHRDHQVDPVALVAALQTAATAAGAGFVPATAVRVVVQQERVVAVGLTDGEEIAARSVVLAAGAWSPAVALPEGLAPPVRPVKGQTLHLQGEPDLLRHVVRGSVRGSPVYLVPRADGRVVVGASAEEAGFDRRPRAGVVHDLLRDAQALVPVVAEMEFVEVRTSLRPGTPDNGPIVGTTDVSGLLFATGHYRNGVLLAPLTADGIAELVATGQSLPIWRPFAPGRFVAPKQRDHAWR